CPNDGVHLTPHPPFPCWTSHRVSPLAIRQSVFVRWISRHPVCAPETPMPDHTACRERAHAWHHGTTGRRVERLPRSIPRMRRDRSLCEKYVRGSASRCLLRKAESQCGRNQKAQRPFHSCFAQSGGGETALRPGCARARRWRPRERPSTSTRFWTAIANCRHLPYEPDLARYREAPCHSGRCLCAH